MFRLRMQLILIVLLSVSGVLFFPSLEGWGQQAGLSYTLAKALPYVLMGILGIALLWSTLKNLPQLKPAPKWILILTLPVLPFVLAFVRKPIYEGEFSSAGTILKQDYVDSTGADLLVFAIPDCDYCHETIPRMNDLITRHPGLKITYVIVDPNRENRQLEPFRRKLNRLIQVTLAPNPDKIAMLTNRRFPAYLIKQNGRQELFNNLNFGTGALDRISALHQESKH